MKKEPSLTKNEKKELMKKNNGCGLARTMDIETIDVDYGYAKSKLTVAEKHLNVHSLLHGAAVLAIADHTAGAAGTTMGRKALALQINTNYLATAKVKVGETIYAEARFVREGKQILYLEIDVLSEKGELISRSTLTGMKFDESPRNDV